MYNPWVAVVLAIFLWWFLTGIILFLVKWADNYGAKTHSVMVITSLPILFIGFFGLQFFSKDVYLFGVYGSFVSALIIWSWLELAFLSGVLTGPNKQFSPEGVTGWMRFKLALSAVAYSEVVLLIFLVMLTWISLGASNQFGYLTFVILYVARLSAKLNLFLGVPRINVEFLPNSVNYLSSHFKCRDTNWLFPISITCLSILVAIWFEKSIAQPSLSSSMVGFALLATLTVLALIEHWFMVLPLPDAKLWRWMIPAKSHSKALNLTQNKDLTNKTV